MITLHYKRTYTQHSFTKLEREGKKKWTWNPCEIREEDSLKKLSLPVLTKKELKEYIHLFKKILQSKREDGTTVKMFLKHFKFKFYRSKFNDLFDIEIQVQNKYNKNFKYGDQEVLNTMQMEEWDNEYLGTPESWGGLSSAENLTEEDLQKYIDELITEYEEVTGEKYEKMKSQYLDAKNCGSGDRGKG